MVRLTATDAARSFSEVLNRVAAGEEFEIVRNGATVAVLSPPKARLLSPERFHELLRLLPRPDDDFAADLRQIRGSTSFDEDPWPSS